MSVKLCEKISKLFFLSFSYMIRERKLKFFLNLHKQTRKCQIILITFFYWPLIRLQHNILNVLYLLSLENHFMTHSLKSQNGNLCAPLNDTRQAIVTRYDINDRNATSKIKKDMFIRCHAWLSVEWLATRREESSCLITQTRSTCFSFIAILERIWSRKDGTFESS